MTILVSATALSIGSVIGGLICWAKLSQNFVLRALAQSYLAIFRGLPELLIIYFVYFGSSALLTSAAGALGHSGFVGFPPFFAGAIAVGIISGAYQAEVFRAAYLSIAKGELEAAVSIGMHRALMFRRVILPQVLRFALPALGNLWQFALKDASLISVTGLVELIRTSQVASGSTHQPFIFFGAAALIYLVITSISDFAFGKAEAVTSRGLRRRQEA
ncbi:MAG: ABC transporter permease subunit [Hyphomicrobiales bacterium]|nr:ABC transporter permease subunit [Hyphomicrobiales bacterium]